MTGLILGRWSDTEDKAASPESVALTFTSVFTALLSESKQRRSVKVTAGVCSMPLVLLLLLFLALQITAIPLPFARDWVRNTVMAALPPGSELQLGDMSLAVEGVIFPVLKFSPVTYSDSRTGGYVRMDALEVGFSPLRALIGQPGASITMVAPHIQMVQDLLGPRLSRFDVVDDPGGGTTVRVMEGSESFPPVAISTAGLKVEGVLPKSIDMGLRSDNDWLIYNLNAAEQSLRDVVTQTEQGRFSRLVIRDGTLEMSDSVYGLLRQFEDINLDVMPKAGSQDTEGRFSVSLGGRKMTGGISRNVDAAGNVQLRADVTNIDFASFMPFLDDPDGMMAIRGSGALSVDVNFNGATGKVTGGQFDIDMTGTDLRIEKQYFPVATSIMKVDWTPENGEFHLEDSQLQVGRSSARLSGVFALGLDKAFGPTLGLSLTARDVRLHPNDMDAPAAPIDEITFKGWSAPLYGALGIDQMSAQKGDTRIAATGRVDMLRQGIGLNLTIAGKQVDTDDLKRLWPYFLATDSRAWFVQSITAGTVSDATLHFDFSPGTLAREGEKKPVPQNGIKIDMVGQGVVVAASDITTPIAVNGDTRVSVRDNEVTIAADGGQIPTDKGPIDVTNPALVVDSSVPGMKTVEVSGDIKGDIPAMLALARQQQPQLIENAKLPVDMDALSGRAGLDVVTTIELGENGAMTKADYVINGTLSDFASKAPIQNRTIKGGQLSFSATQASYSIAGKADVDGMPVDLSVQGTPTGGTPTLQVASTLEAKDLASMGFDASDFLSGPIRFAASPQQDGSIALAVDLTNATLNIRDIGISKKAGIPGLLKATVHQSGSTVNLDDVDLAFGDVSLKGDLVFDADKKALKSAEFSSFALSPGDQAQLSMSPVTGGYAVRIRGQQLDLKPMLQRYFGLGEGSTGGVKATSFKEALSLDVQLDRAVGFYKTTAYNLNLDLALQGSDIQHVQMQAQLGDKRAVSVATNPSPNGHTMSVAFNDFGTLLRLIGVYPRVEGGEGSLVLVTDNKQNADAGEFLLRNFALIDEDKVAQILGNHRDSRALIAKENKLEFKSGRLDFIRRSDRIQVTDGVLAGMSVGGTIKGFIYTDKRQYDLVGTYVPLFGLNSALAKLPLLGPLLTGPDGAGIFGVTFAVRGPLDKPDFQVNPASLLAPGALRSLFEFRAQELPREQ